jgi:hypothetical protein
MFIGIEVECGSNNLGEKSATDNPHLLVQHLHLVISTHQDDADNDQDKKGKDQDAGMLSLHEKSLLICGDKSIGRSCR